MWEYDIMEMLPMKNNNVSEKILLRKFDRNDVDAFYTWASDPEVTQHMTWETYSTKEEAENFLIEVVEGHPWFRAICFEGKVVGSITLTPGKGIYACRADMGYVLAKDFWGKGIATAAVIKAIKSGFEELNIHRIEAFVDPANNASRRVLEKSTMSCEGLFKNYMLFKGVVRDRYVYATIKNTHIWILN
jgi:[ribosomal protein S5]-alanine N-acetyltransferase